LYGVRLGSRLARTLPFPLTALRSLRVQAEAVQVSPGSTKADIEKDLDCFVSHSSRACLLPLLRQLIDA
jgi:hypothetical protein